MSSQFSSKGAYSNYLNNTAGNRSLMNPYCLNPLFDPNMLAAMLTSGIGGGVMDPFSAMNYLNQMGSYQDILRQYQSNISSITNLATSLSNTSSNVTNMNNALTMSTTSNNINSNLNQFGNLNNLSNLTVKQMINLANNSSSSTASRSSPLYQQSSTKTTTTTTSSTIKERPDISITPVGTSSYKQKFPSNFPQGSKTNSQMSVLKNSNQPKSTSTKPSSSSPKPVAPPIPPKPIADPVKPIPPVKSVPVASKPVSAPKTIVPPAKPVSVPSKSIPAPVKPIPVKPIQKSTPPSKPPASKQSSQLRVSTSVPQPAHHNPSVPYSSLKGSGVVSPNMMMKQIPTNIQGRSGNTLQHKLQSKKQQPVNPVKKQQKTNLPSSLSNFHSIHTPFSGSSHFLPAELSVSVNTVPKGQSSKSPSLRKQKSMKSTELLNPLTQSKVNETLSALSQLQQHSSIEIIPQQKTQNLDFAKNLPKALSVLPQCMPESLKSSGDLSVFEIPKKSGNTTNNKRNDKPPANDGVEIITLDD